MIDPGLKDRVVLITAANNPYGIGASVASAFAAQGAKVFLDYLRQLGATTAIDPWEARTFPGAASYWAQQLTSR